LGLDEQNLFEIHDRSKKTSGSWHTQRSNVEKKQTKRRGKDWSHFGDFNPDLKSISSHH
jgi:hypothetical protein